MIVVRITIDVWHEHEIIARIPAKRFLGAPRPKEIEPLPTFGDDGSATIGNRTWAAGEWTSVIESDRTPEGYCAWFTPDPECPRHPSMVRLS